MRQRAMFSKTIVSSARFLTMSPSAQALYFHLGMYADDEGIVEAYQILKMTEAKEDDFKLLVTKNFIKILNDELVTFVVDWNENNLLRSDRKKPSIYHNLLVKILPDNQLTTKCQPTDNQLTTTGQPLDNHWTTPRQDKTSKRQVQDKTSKESVCAQIVAPLSLPKDKMIEFIDGIEKKDKTYIVSLIDTISQTWDNPRQQIYEELHNFYDYWTEPSKSGKKQKWEMEKTFELSRRFNKWLTNHELWAKK